MGATGKTRKMGKGLMGKFEKKQACQMSRKTEAGHGSCYRKERIKDPLNQTHTINVTLKKLFYSGKSFFSEFSLP